MPVFEFHCRACKRTTERRITYAEVEAGQWCEHDGEQLDLLVSRPAWFPTGKYGKGGRQ